MEYSENIPVGKAGDVRERNRLFWKNVFSPVAMRKLEEDVQKLRTEIDRADPENRLEELVLDNMRNFADGSEDLAKYISGRGDITAPEAVDSVYGDGTFEKLKHDLENYNWEAAYQARKMEIERKTVDPRRYREKLEAELGKIAEAVEKYGGEQGLVPEGLEMNIVPIPSSRNQRAFYNAEQREVNIGLDYFNVVKNNGNLEIEATETVYAIFHEFVGHAAHHHNSLKLGYPQFTDRTVEDTPASAHAEAVGIISRRHAEEFIRENKGDLKVSEQGLEIKKHKLEVKSDTGKILAAFLNEMESRGEIDSAEDQLAELVSKEWGKKAAENWDGSPKRAFKETAYTAGENLLDKTEYDDYQALTTGLWNPKTLPKYLKYREK